MFKFFDLTPIEAIIAFKGLEGIKKEEFFGDREVILAIEELNNCKISYKESYLDNSYELKLTALKKAVIYAFEAEFRSRTHAIIS